jgi:hypothetical protein
MRKFSFNVNMFAKSKSDKPFESKAGLKQINRRKKNLLFKLGAHLLSKQKIIIIGS